MRQPEQYFGLYGQPLQAPSATTAFVRIMGNEMPQELRKSEAEMTQGFLWANSQKTGLFAI